MPSSEVVQALEREGFEVKIADDGVIAYLNGRKLSRHEIVDAVPELEGCPMGRVEAGIFIQVGEEKFPI